jgi:methylmalonyl-CoA mutase N-terminal domain/subunit
VAYESGVPQTADPLGGSYFVEALTNEIEAKAWEYINKIDEMGGAVEAIEAGYIQREIADSAYKYQRDIESGEKVIVGVNKFVVAEKPISNLFSVDDHIRVVQTEKLAKVKAERNNDKVKTLLLDLENAAKENRNLMPCILAAVEEYASLGEVSDTLRGVFGEYTG